MLHHCEVMFIYNVKLSCYLFAYLNIQPTETCLTSWHVPLEQLYIIMFTSSLMLIFCKGRLILLSFYFSICCHYKKMLQLKENKLSIYR